MVVLSGRILMVNNQLELLPILLGLPPPSSTGWPGATVTAICDVPLVIGDIELTFSATTADNGTYSITGDVPEPSPGQQVWVAITVSIFGVPVYRSGRVALDTVSNGKLNFWIYPYPVSPSDGITAGKISSLLSKNPTLPSGTTLTTSPAGLDVSFSEAADLVDAWFGVAVRPDSSPNLQSFVDLSLRYVNIVDLLPPFVHPNGGEILQAIADGVGGAAGDLNQQVLAMMESDLEKQDKVSATAAQKFFTQDVSVTFTNISITNHTWKITATDDNTVVLTATLCIGFPRNPTPGEPIL